MSCATTRRAATDFFGEGVAEGRCVGAAVVADGEGAGVGVALSGDGDAASGVAVTVTVGSCVGCCATTFAAAGVGVCTTTTGELFATGAGEWRAANAESNAPIPRPAMMTAANNGTIGRPPRSSSSPLERRRRGPSELMFFSVPRERVSP